MLGGSARSRACWTRYVFPRPSAAAYLLRDNLQIQPDMIALNPEFIGSLAPEPKLTTAVNGAHDIPFARLPRLERLRVQGKADETEDTDADAPGADGEDDEDEEQKKKSTKEEKEKKKMRGKNKALKRFLRKQRKNVIDPRAVSALRIYF